MTARSRTACLTLLLTAVLSGCQADTDPGSQPADPTTPPTSGGATDGAEDPLRFFSHDRRVSFRCFPDGVRRIVHVDQLRARRPVTLTGISGGGEALRITGSWVAPLPPKQVRERGNLDLDAGGSRLSDVRGWGDRQPFDGAELEPGTTYSFFVRTAVRPDLPLDDFVLGWDDGTATGASTFDNDGRTRSGGC